MKATPVIRLVLAIVLFAIAAAGATPPAQAQSDDEPVGLIDETTWESPQFGIEVTWDDEGFTPNTEWISSDEDTGIDILSLGGDNTTFDVFAIGSVGSTVETYLDELIAFRADDLEDADFDALIAESDGDLGWYAYLATEDDQAFVTIGEIALVDDEFFQIAQLSVWLTDLEDGFPAVQAAIEVEGDEPFVHYWTEDTLADLDLEMPADTNTDETDNPDDDEDLPAAEDSWTAPQYDTDVTWADDWNVDVDGTFSDPDFLDNLRLETDDTYFQVTVATLQDETLREWMDRQLAFREDAEDTESIDIVDEGRIDGGRYLVYEWTTIEDETWYVYREVVATDDDEIIRSVEFFTLVSDPQDIFDLAQETIEIDGQVPFVQDDPLEDLV